MPTPEQLSINSDTSARESCISHVIQKGSLGFASSMFGFISGVGARVVVSSTDPLSPWLPLIGGALGLSTYALAQLLFCCQKWSTEPTTEPLLFSNGHQLPKNVVLEIPEFPIFQDSPPLPRSYKP